MGTPVDLGRPAHCVEQLPSAGLRCDHYHALRLKFAWLAKIAP